MPVGLRIEVNYTIARLGRQHTVLQLRLRHVSRHVSRQSRVLRNHAAVDRGALCTLHYRSFFATGEGPVQFLLNCIVANHQVLQLLSHALTGLGPVSADSCAVSVFLGYVTRVDKVVQMQLRLLQLFIPGNDGTIFLCVIDFDPRGRQLVFSGASLSRGIQRTDVATVLSWAGRFGVAGPSIQNSISGHQLLNLLVGLLSISLGGHNLTGHLLNLGL